MLTQRKYFSIPEFLEFATCFIEGGLMDKENGPTSIIATGEPGIGKTAMAKQLCQNLEKVLGVPGMVTTFSLSTADRSDVKGLPDITGKNTVWKPLLEWSKVQDICEKGGFAIVHFDEVTLMAEDVEGSILNLINDKKIDDLQLSSRVIFLLTGNDGGDDGTRAKAFSAAITGGRCFIYGIKSPSPSEVCDYLRPMGLPLWMEKFISTFGYRVLTTPYKREMPYDPWTTARSWEKFMRACINMMSSDGKTRGLDPDKDTHKIMALAAGMFPGAVQELLYKFIGDAILNPFKLMELDKAEWAKFARCDQASRKSALKDILDKVPKLHDKIPADERTEWVTKLTGVCNKIIETGTVKEVMSAFSTDLCAKHALLHRDVKVTVKDENGKDVEVGLSKYNDSLMKDGMAKAAATKAKK